MLGIIEKVKKAYKRLSSPPQHIRLIETARTHEDCLWKLEKAASLPRGDLRIDGEPVEVLSFPAMRPGLQYRLISATSEQWRSDPNKDGYIAGTLFETTGPTEVSLEQLYKMDSWIAAGFMIGHICIGSLHISKNCPGVYENGVCKSCGDISH